MSNASTFNEIPHQVVGPPGCMFSELTTAQSNSVGSATLISLLLEWANEQRCQTGVAKTGMKARSINTPLRKLSAGPWISGGEHFDYSDWAARERFMELDK